MLFSVDELEGENEVEERLLGEDDKEERKETSLEAIGTFRGHGSPSLNLPNNHNFLQGRGKILLFQRTTASDPVPTRINCLKRIE